MFSFLELKVSEFKNQCDKYRLIVLDEISISSKLCYDNSNRKFIGNVTLGDTNTASSNALVFKLVRISQRLKQVIDYFFTSPSMNGAVYKPLLINYIKMAHVIE